MGQKANLLTLRKIENVLNIKEENTKIFLNILEFLKLFKYFLQLKNVWAFQIRLRNEKNICRLEMFLFFLTTKANFFKKLKKLPPKNVFRIKKGAFSSFFHLFFSVYKKNLYLLSFINLNAKINKKYILFFFKKSKKFLKFLFDRRYGLFLDFLKINALLCQGLIGVSSYLVLLSAILRFLTKRNHSKFLEFLKEIFESILLAVPNQVLGLKFLINGKLKGKARSDSYLISKGQISQQTLLKNVDFGVIHTNTRFGVFGMRIWLCTKNKIF